VAYLFRFQCCPVSDSRVFLLTIDGGGVGQFRLNTFVDLCRRCSSQDNKTISLAFVLQRSGGEAVVVSMKVFVNRQTTRTAEWPDDCGETRNLHR